MVDLLDRNFSIGDRIEVLLIINNETYFHCGIIVNISNKISCRLDGEDGTRNFSEGCLRRTDCKGKIKYSYERLHNPKYYLGSK
jgi:hypothetical protein